jgi:hypothetical protein
MMAACEASEGAAVMATVVAPLCCVRARARRGKMKWGQQRRVAPLLLSPSAWLVGPTPAYGHTWHTWPGTGRPRWPVWNRPEANSVRARPTETTMFFYLYLPIQHEFVKNCITESCRAMWDLQLCFRHIESVNQFWLSKNSKLQNNPYFMLVSSFWPN